MTDHEEDPYADAMGALLSTGKAEIGGVTIDFTQPRKGVTINGGKAHVEAPGVRPKTRCGRVLRSPNSIVQVPDVDVLPEHGRCAQCFPGTGRRGTEPRDT